MKESKEIEILAWVGWNSEGRCSCHTLELNCIVLWGTGTTKSSCMEKWKLSIHGANWILFRCKILWRQKQRLPKSYCECKTDVCQTIVSTYALRAVNFQGVCLIIKAHSDESEILGGLPSRHNPLRPLHPPPRRNTDLSPTNPIHNLAKEILTVCFNLACVWLWIATKAEYQHQGEPPISPNKRCIYLKIGAWIFKHQMQ